MFLHITRPASFESPSTYLKAVNFHSGIRELGVAFCEISFIDMSNIYVKSHTGDTINVPFLFFFTWINIPFILSFTVITTSLEIRLFLTFTTHHNKVRRIYPNKW